MNNGQRPYIGRFAPSPTGPLHLGSLFAALVSYLHAKQNQGQWLIRIEDVDPLREQKGASASILRTLEAHGLLWDKEVVYQSDRKDYYERALTELKHSRACFYCPCSRKHLSNGKGHLPDCISQENLSTANCAIKFKSNNTIYSWYDGFQGQESLALKEDFVLKRKEGFYSYQLAVVCDDIEQNISHVVRGHDLLYSSPMQLALYQALKQKAPKFLHFPVLVSQGQKLSKQNLAPEVSAKEAQQNLHKVFQLLGIEELDRPRPIKEALEIALACWDPAKLKGKTELLI